MVNRKGVSLKGKPIFCRRMGGSLLNWMTLCVFSMRMIYVGLYSVYPDPSSKYGFKLNWSSIDQTHIVHDVYMDVGDTI